MLHYPKESKENYLTLEGDRERKVIMVNASGHDWIDIMPSEADEEMASDFFVCAESTEWETFFTENLL